MPPPADARETGTIADARGGGTPSERPAPLPAGLAHSAGVASPPSVALVAACLLTVYLVWGSTYLAIRIAVEALPPFLLAGVRALVAGAILLAWASLRGLPRASRRESWNAALLGLLLIAGGNGLVTWAQQWVSSSLAAAMVSSGAIWVVVFTALLGERPSRGEKVGIFIGFAGVVLLNAQGEMRAYPPGALALFGATLTWASGSVLSRRLVVPVGARNVALQMLSGGLVMTLVGLAAGERLVVEAVTARAALAWLYLVVAGSLVAFSAFTFLIRNVRPALATSFAYVNPAVALLVGVVFGGEHMGALGYAGVVVSIVGVAVLTLARRPS